MAFLEKFGSFEIAKAANGRPIELPRSPDEVVFLAFDTRIKRLVELHVLRGGEKLSITARRSAAERARQASALPGGSLLHVLDSGEDDGVAFYSTELIDGEILNDYIARRGALPPPTTFSLALALLDELTRLGSAPRLLGGICLEKLLVSLQAETFLQLRVVDLGLSSPERHHSVEDIQRHLVYQSCLVLFHLLTGRPHAGDDCDRYPALTSLPTGLRAMLRSSLASPDNSPSSLERLRDEVRDALASQARDLQRRASRRHLVATDAMLPKSSLRDVLLHDVDIDRLLRDRLLPDGAERVRYPFSILASDARTSAPLTAHLLPPRRVVAGEHYDAVPLQMWRFNAEKHPNILRSLSVWESPDLTFLTEERGPGFPLNRLLAERVHLNPPEVLLILRQVNRGLDQALDCGVEHMDLHPSNITLRLSGTPPGREMERLLQKRLDAWPRFLVMLRPHMTMRALYEPMMVTALEFPHDEEHLAARDFRARSFVSLASYLLSGEAPQPGHKQLPDSVPDDLRNFVSSCVIKTQVPGKTPTPQDFLAEFEKRTQAPEDAEPGGISLPARATLASRAPVDQGPMESAGSVSDFDDQPSVARAKPSAVLRPSAGGKKTTGLLSVPMVPQRPARHLRSDRIGMIAWALGLAVLLIIVFSLLRNRGQAANSEESPAAANHKKINPAMRSPEEVRRALVPSETEREALRRQELDRAAAEKQDFLAREPVLDTKDT